MDWEAEARKLGSLSHADLLQLDPARMQSARRDPKELGRAFRAQAMVWHPDHHMQKSRAEQDYCNARFRRVLDAYTALRRQAARGRA